MDQKIVSELQAGNNDRALSLIFDEFYERVYRYIYIRLGNHANTQDTISEVFITLIKVIDHYDFKAKLSTFIFGIAHNKVLQQIDQLKKQGVPLDDENLISSPIEINEDHLDKFIKLRSKIWELLPTNYKLVLELRFLQGFTLKQTALELGTNANNIKIIQHRALARAKKIWKTLL